MKSEAKVSPLSRKFVNIASMIKHNEYGFI